MAEREPSRERREELGIDELARRAGMTVRNVRAYQDRGLIAPPEKRGRVGVYNEVHLMRLRVIGHLLKRGFTLTHIRDLMGAWEQGQGVGEAMELDEVLSWSWSTEVPGTATIEELGARFRTLSPALLAKAEALGYLEREEDGFRVPSPRLLHIAEELVEAGIPLSAILEQAASLREDVVHIAEGFARLVVENVFDRYGPDRLPPAEERPHLASIVARLRPLAQGVVNAELAWALERAVHEALGERLARALLASVEEGEGRDRKQEKE